MAFSDDDEEMVLQSVTDYHFVDEKDGPISFSVLPFQFSDAERPNSPKKEVFVRGNADGGLQKVYKQVTSWKLGLDAERPEVMVFTKDSKWIKLLKPRKAYEGIIKTILITVQSLHFLKRKPESTEKTLLEHLRKFFVSFEAAPSVNDLLDHCSLLKLFVERDEALAKCQMLLALLKQPRKKSFDEDFQKSLDSNKSFIVEDDDIMEDMVDGDGNESDEEEESDLFDSVCAICDNGGELLCCEGRCMRSFHATRSDGEDSECKSLGYTKAQVEAIQNFLCRNCKYKQHQCYVCGLLGSSDKSAGAEVFPCVNATCGYFYHPKCVANLLFKENEAEAMDCEKKIAAGESFTCPVHKCYVCKQVENKEVKELQFAICRRCPKSYHRKCLPRKISFEDIEEEDIIQRAWDDLLPNRVLIYCLKHRIDEDLGTPRRNHIKFPEIPGKERAVDVLRKKLLKKKQVSVGPLQERVAEKQKKSTEKLFHSGESKSALKSRSTGQQMPNLKKQLKPLKIGAESELTKPYGSVTMDRKKPSKEKPVNEKTNSAVPVHSPSIGKISGSSYPKISIETEKKMAALMKDASSSVKLDDILKKREMQFQAYTARSIDKSITHGKVEGFVEAVRAALQKLDAGGAVEEAKAVCESGILTELAKWNSKLKVYLAPVIHGTRYTSWGRHFTQVSKLKEIVDKLQWYVQDGDTIVDFCCGANDFSLLLKEKLDAAGKRNCGYKNYDLFQSKNDFNFERRDWHSVKREELPTGSKLIMGLNPPFGVKAQLANQFIDKALTFKPKLIILIVPPETQRLDEKRSPYDLIWEDKEKLKGKSFYLPGSVDIYDMQIEQWNNTPPPLYLWSRSDWTSRHREVASKQGHFLNSQQPSLAEGETQEQMAGGEKSPEKISEREESKEPIIPDGSAEEGSKTHTDNKMIPKSERKRSPPRSQGRGRKGREKRRKTAVAAAEAKEREQATAEAKERNDGEQSDMSISPPDTRNSMEGPSEAISLEFRTSEGSKATSSVLDPDDIAKRYITPSSQDSYFAGSSYNLPNERIRSNQDYPVRSSEERFPSYGSVDGFSRNYVDDARMPTTRAYGFEGQTDVLDRGRYPYSSGFESSFRQPPLLPSSAPYGQSGSNSEASVTQRYAPRLDEMNVLGRLGNFGPDGFGSRERPTVSMPPPGSFGFAPGPRQGRFQPHGSGGWLDD